ncbi:alanine dehydrogenase [Aureispira sp. CCB-QB1]|uniref:alanine dehydrogenase n=1 Tax=Aureispira sp. CCB-QB1 TaxID=1313421 RepID=UPI0006988EB8|nr:alanine dehydrogenase [Aureispira sp. CCB-QB1]
MEKRKIDIPQRLTQNMLTPQEECLEIPQKKAKLFIGIPKERSFQENRVALSPAAVKTLVNAGHKIVVEEDAGLEAGFLDFEYSEAGAEIAYSSEQVFKAHVIIKVAPPSLQEIDLCHPGQIIISPIHLPSLSEEYIYRLKKKRVTALAMEYMKDQSGIFPFVHSMSEMAGISAMQTAAELLSKSGNGLGILLGGIPGIPPAKVVILGAGVVAEVATRVALGYGAEVRVFDNNIRKLMRLQGNLRQKIYTGTFNSPELEVELRDAEVVIGAIHSEIGRTPIIVSDSMVKNMKSGSVIIDVSIDQGGCFATSRMTTHDKPTFIEYDVIHYCVPNIVARIPQTSSKAISNILIPFFLEAGGTQGIEALLHSSPGFRNGVYMYKGCLTNKYLSDFFNVKYTDLNLLLASNL